MKKILFVLGLVVFSKSNAQQIETGINLGYGFVNIINSKAVQNRAVIGDALWSFNYGGSLLNYFNPNEEILWGLHARYNHNIRGSKSEIYSGSTIEIPSNTFSVAARVAKNSHHQFGFYIEAGFGYNALGKMKFSGNKSQLDVFNDNLEYEIVPKSNEVTFVYGLGLEREIPKSKLKAFIEISGDAAISKISSNTGSYRTQGLTIGTGVRYIFKSNK